MRNHTLALVIAGALSLNACAVRMDVPSTTIATSDALAGSAPADAAFELEWWRRFDDPVLDSLVADGFRANRELQGAAARFAAAAELAGVAHLARVPTGAGVVGATRRHLSELEAGGLDLPSRTLSFVNAGIAVGWEADVFNRLGARARASAADAQANAWDAHAVGVAMAAQIASAYFDWRGAQRERELVGDIRERTRALVARTTRLVAEGRVIRTELNRLRQSESDLEAEDATIRHTAERARLRLATLTGRTAEGWQIPDVQPRRLRVAMFPLGGGAATIQRRPDVLAAERRVQAAAARAGAARADLFPRVELTGSLGLVAGDVGSLTHAAAGSWFVAPRIAWALLDWPQLKRRMRAAGALTNAAFADYEQTLLRALEEVRVAIHRYETLTEQLRTAEGRAEATASTASIVTVQYREGYADAPARLAAEREAVRGALVVSRALTDQRDAVVGVYRALGGGW